jgi:hypothetical protein
MRCCHSRRWSTRVWRSLTRAQVDEMLRRDPRLRPPADHQQLPQMAGVGAVALGALLGAAARRRLGRLGQVYPRADRLELLDHEPPARRRLQRDLELLIAKAVGEPPHAGAIGRRHAPARHLTGRRVNPLSGDLRSMLIESHCDRHKGPPQAPRFERLRGRAPR